MSNDCCGQPMLHKKQKLESGKFFNYLECARCSFVSRSKAPADRKPKVEIDEGDDFFGDYNE